MELVCGMHTCIAWGVCGFEEPWGVGKAFPSINCVRTPEESTRRRFGDRDRPPPPSPPLLDVLFLEKTFCHATRSLLSLPPPPFLQPELSVIGL
jgi:hypothetical protein